MTEGDDGDAKKEGKRPEKNGKNLKHDHYYSKSKRLSALYVWCWFALSLPYVRPSTSPGPFYFCCGNAQSSPSPLIIALHNKTHHGTTHSCHRPTHLLHRCSHATARAGGCPGLSKTRKVVPEKMVLPVLVIPSPPAQPAPRLLQHCRRRRSSSRRRRKSKERVYAQQQQPWPARRRAGPRANVRPLRRVWSPA